MGEFHYEHHEEPVIERIQYWMRLLRHVGFAFALLLASLGIGVIGFKLIAGMDWLPAFVDASMLLGGMGPVRCNEITSTAGQVFAAFYALFCGIVFLVAMGAIVTPIIHRFLHKFHEHLHETPMANKVSSCADTAQNGTPARQT